MNKLNFWEWLDRVKMSLLFFFGILVLLFSFALLMGFRFLQDQLINQGKYAVIVNQEREKRDQEQVKVEAALQAQIFYLSRLVDRQGSMIQKDSLEKKHLLQRADQNEKLIGEFGQAYNYMATHNQHLLDSINGSIHLSLDQQKAWASLVSDTSFARFITDQARKSFKGKRTFKNEFLDLDIYLFDDSTYVTGKVYDKRVQSSEVIKKINAIGIARPVAIQSTLTSLNPYIVPQIQSEKLAYQEKKKSKTRLKTNRHTPKAPTKEPKR